MKNRVLSPIIQVDNFVIHEPHVSLALWDDGHPQEDKAAAKKARNSNKWIFVASADLKRFYIAPKV